MGSTFIKYAFWDGGETEVLRLPFPERKETHGECYFVDREAIEEKIFSIVNEGEKAGYERLFVSVQMHGILWREKDGRISDYLSWRDGSGDVDGEEFKDIDFSLRGTALKKNLPLCKAALWSGSEELFTLGSYIAYILTGQNATHITDACASGFYHADTGELLSHPAGMKMPRACLGVSFF